MTTGEKIAKCRKEKNLTQENLAGALGVSRQAVSRWESDLAFPETDHLTKMCRLFGVTADYLLNYGSDDKTNENISESSVKTDTSINFFEYLKKFHIEYISKNRIGKLPLIHINIGVGRTAKGFFAIGFKSTGIISAGLISCGVISLGLLSLGIISLGILALGLLSAATFAVGVVALGAITVGMFAMGAINAGLFSAGAISYGYFVAIGDRAYGGIALGYTVANGRVISVTVESFEEMKTEIYRCFDKIPKVFSLFTYWSRSLFDGVLNGIIKLGGSSN